jgi:hypothetical protein
MVVKLKKAVCHGGLHNGTIGAVENAARARIHPQSRKMQAMKLHRLSVRI